jgi:hypothetical protein
MRLTLSEKEISAIEKAINKSPGAEAIVKIEHSRITVLQAERKKIV